MFKHSLLGFFLITLLAFAGNAQAETVDFNLPDLAGKSHRLSDYRGKWVVVNYWATWCPPCLTEIPELVDFHEENQAKDAVVIGISFEDVDVKQLKAFVEDYFINYLILRERPGRGSVMGDIPGLPTTFVVSPEGEIMARQVGGVTAEMLSDFINEQNEERSGPPGFVISRNRSAN